MLGTLMTDSAAPWAITPEPTMHPDRRLIIASFLINIVNPHTMTLPETGNTFSKNRRCQNSAFQT
jgi:hypothetical protein